MKKFLLKKQTVIVLCLSILFGVINEGAIKAQNTVEIDGIVYALASKYAMVFPKDLEYNEELQTDISSYSGDINIPSTVSYNDKDYTVNTIYFEAFKGSDITSITLPNTIEEILKDAFVGCTHLRSITLPASVESLDDNETNVFAYCTSLQEINVDPANTKYASQDGVLYNKAMTILRAFPGGVETFSNFPETVQRIGSESFAGGNIKSLVISNSITSIISDAFYDCKNLESVTLSANLKTIPSGCFEGCTKLKYVEIPEGVTQINSWAFAETAVEYIKIPEGVEILQDEAFWDCMALKTIDFPSTIQFDMVNSIRFFNSPVLSTVISRKITPPVIEDTGHFYYSDANWMWTSSNLDKTLYVPSEGMDNYKNQYEYGYDNDENRIGWGPWGINRGGFSNYLPLEDYEAPSTGISSLNERINNSVIEVYNLQGLLVMRTNDKTTIDNLPKGIYIIDGKKCVIK